MHTTSPTLLTSVSNDTTLWLWSELARITDTVDCTGFLAADFYYFLMPILP